MINVCFSVTLGVVLNSVIIVVLVPMPDVGLDVSPSGKMVEVASFLVVLEVALNSVVPVSVGSVSMLDVRLIGTPSGKMVDILIFSVELEDLLKSVVIF